MRAVILCVAALVIGALAGAARAQTEVRERSAAQLLACLVKPDKAPDFPVKNRVDRGFGGMRVLLKFSKPDAAPEVEVLFNSARQDMQDEAYRYLARLRLPCLSPKDGVVTAVQEFSFVNTDREATPLDGGDRAGEPPFCLVMPRRDMRQFDGLGHQNIEHVIATATFTGDGRQPPEVKILHTTGSRRFEAAVRERLAEYRMPCRQGTEAPQSLQQQFSMFPGEKPRYAFHREALGLVEFLRMTREPGQLRAAYDLNTMGCPFKVDFTVYGGALPNEAKARGPLDPNKLPFLSWLAGLQLAFKDEAQANALFGSQLQIDVPCGTLDLPGEAPAPAR